MEFEWDPTKSVSNEEKHGISFEQAITAFDDPYALLAPDEKHSTENEMREWLIGESDFGVLVVVFTKRGRKVEKICRIISARCANRIERKLYEEFKKFSI